MFKQRGSGVLLHITSLPSKFGIGDFGPDAYRFADTLAHARQCYWQILPLKPTNQGTGNSPYSSFSAFAGNPLLISPEMLYRDNFLTKIEIQSPPAFPDQWVDFASVIPYKRNLLNLAYERFKTSKNKDSYGTFCENHKSWLEDYSLFLALYEHFKGAPWNHWPKKIRDRDPKILADLKKQFSDAIQREQFIQYAFCRQWCSLKTYCNDSGIQIIGDIAMYVGYDSADLWSHREVFKLTKQGKPKYVAGFPPDQFNPAGQLWGNPVYDWDAMKKTGYRWWIDRIRHSFSMYDVLRIDHFRGFIEYWQIPAGHKTAEKGKWMPGPKESFYCELVRHFTFPSLIVEVLGIVTPELTQFLEKFDLPDMNILIFAFESDFHTGIYYPHNYDKNSVVYTDTHDTATILGWFDKIAKPKDKERLFRYLGRKIPRSDLHWQLIRLAMMSSANVAIVSMQDILGQGAEGRMNIPGVARGQWRWRFDWNQLKPHWIQKLKNLTETYGRC